MCGILTCSYVHTFVLWLRGCGPIWSKSPLKNPEVLLKPGLKPETTRRVWKAGREQLNVSMISGLEHVLCFHIMGIIIPTD